ncbi:lipid droplet-associated protein [Williamsia sp. M5A3_1d]
MFRPPFAARVVTGLIVTAIEETKKLPTTAVTLPMTAVSSTVQAAMRMQQNIAELAIKGDEVFDTLFHRAEEKPEWATFDDDDAFVDPRPTRVDRSPAADDGDDQGDDRSAGASRDADSSSEPEKDGDEKDGRATVTPISAAPGAATVTPADMPEHQAETVEPTPPVKKAPAKKAPAKKAAAKAPAKKAPAKKAPAKKAAPKAPAASDDDAGTTGKGRFALYSSAPETVLQSDVESSPAAPAADAPEIVEFLDYDTLTLAQLRAKIRSVDLDDLKALADYERGHRGRAPFQTMLDNRITAASAK